MNQIAKVSKGGSKDDETMRVLELDSSLCLRSHTPAAVTSLG